MATLSITQERNALSKVPGAPSLRRREQWGSTFNYTTSRSVDHPASRVFIHISVTNPSAYRSNDAHARALEAIGRTRFPNTGISYNRGCMVDATLYEFQPMGRRGAHTVNDFRRPKCTLSGCPGRGTSLEAPSWNLNVNSRAYVICQNVGDPVSDKQVDQIARAIVADYFAGFLTYEAAHNIHGHRCVSSKSCPGDRMWQKMSLLHTKIHHYLDNGLGGSTSAGGDPKLLPCKKGDKGQHVQFWQRMLRYIGYTTPITSVYDADMVKAVNKHRADLGHKAYDAITPFHATQIHREYSEKYGKGATGPGPTDAQIASAVDAWLKANVDLIKGEPGESHNPADLEEIRTEVDNVKNQLLLLIAKVETWEDNNQNWNHDTRLWNDTVISKLDLILELLRQES